LKHLTATAAILLIFQVLAPAAAHSGDADMPELGVEGNMFVDWAGREVILRGANAGGRSKLPPFLPFEPEPDFETALDKYAGVLELMGMNVVRLLVMYEAAEPVRGEYNEEYLAKYDRLVEEFSSRGFRIIVDNHQDVFSRRFCGDGYPDWMIPEKYRNLKRRADCSYWELRYFHPGVMESFKRYWSNYDGVQDRHLEFFRMMAERYKDNPAVIGFEPVNEPFPGSWGIFHYFRWHDERLYPFYERVGRVVNSVDPRYIVFADICSLENPGVWKTDRKKPDVANLALAPHYYDMGYAKVLWFSPGGDIETMRAGLAKHTRLARKWNVPVLVGEYGVSMAREDPEQYLARLYTVFDEMFLSGTIWEASMSEILWNGRDKGILAPDGTVLGPAWAIDRPYPRAVAGAISSFSFDPESLAFRIEWTENPAATLPSEIYLPERLYGDSPSIRLDPQADFSFDPETRVLTVGLTGNRETRTAAVLPR